MKDNALHSGLIFIGALALFLPMLGSVHLFDWDELNFAEAAREMLLTGNFGYVQIDFKPFFEKPPLFFWMQSASMSLFGVNEFAARFPNAICGAFTLVVIYNIGRRWFDTTLARWWVLTYLGALLPVLYFKTGIIDPWFNLFIFLGIYYGARFTSKFQERKKRVVILSGFFMALALLVKGPVGLLIFGLSASVYYVIKRFYGFPRIPQILLFLAVFLSVGGSWFLYHFISGTPEVIFEFIRVQQELFSTGVAGHAQPFYYHFVVLLIGCFPISIFAIPSLGKKRLDTYEREHFHLWMKIMFWVVLILFSIVKTKIVHYSSLTYFPLTFLAALTLYRLEKKHAKFPKILVILGLITAFLLSVAFSALPWLEVLADSIDWSNVDMFTTAQFTQEVDWPLYTRFIGAAYFLFSAVFLFGLAAGRISWARYQLAVGLVFTMIVLLVVTPKAERYFQNSAIEFYKKAAKEEAYIVPIGMKSYGYLFYSEKPGPTPVPEDYNEEQWLLTGPIDKNAYFVSRNKRIEELLSKYPELELVEENGGYALYRRRAKP